MTPSERHQRITELFHAAMELDAHLREGFVLEQCSDDPDLRREMLALLRAESAVRGAGGADAADQLDRAVKAEAALIVDSLEEGPGAQIGPYRLVKRIGEGGFGVVFLAEQDAPVTRRVALKIIKLGMDTRSVIARFEAERQALAMMDHAGIAQVLDAGATPGGRPWFAMELVLGDPITAHCAEQGLDVRERLELFVQVCSAVQHAHQKGVIHRDLKPANILVTPGEGRTTVRIIDFGIAKALRGRLTDKTIHTDYRQLVGTPQYMSPEQADGSGDIDTRADIYALGAILYELLAGSPPLDAAALRAASVTDAQRMIREQTPERPSSRRAGDAGGAGRARIPHDLDWIVMKCLEKDRRRRYATVDGLSDDVMRHLTGAAVHAAPPSRLYRAGKFIRRHWVGAGASAAVSVAVIAGAIAISIFAAREAAARADADRRSHETEQVAAFQARMLSGIEPRAAGERLMADLVARYGKALQGDGPDGGASDARVESLRAELGRVNATDLAAGVIDHAILAPAAAAVAEEFADQPVVEATISQTLADIYERLGLNEAAAPLQERALQLRRTALGDDDPETIATMLASGILLVQRGRLAEAEVLLDEALAQARGALGEEHPTTFRCLNSRAMIAYRLGRQQEGESLMRQTIDLGHRIFGEGAPETFLAVDNLGTMLQAQGRLLEAEPILREALRQQQAALGEDHADTIIAMNNLSMLLKDLGRLDEAQEQCRQALDRSRIVHGESHQMTFTLLANLATIFTEQGRLSDAEPLYLEAIEKARSVHGDHHPTTITFLYCMGYLLRVQGRFADAAEYCSAALEGSEVAYGPDHPETLSTRRLAAQLVYDQGRLAEAIELYVALLADMRRVMGENHIETIQSQSNLGSLLLEAGRLSEAEVELTAAAGHALAITGPTARTTLDALSLLGEVARQQGRLEEAEVHLSEAVAGYEASIGPDAVRTAVARMRLGMTLAAAGRHGEAETALLAAEAVLPPGAGRAGSRRAQCLGALVDLYTAREADEPGAGHAASAERWRRAIEEAP